MPELNDLTNEVASLARDVAYVAVGLGVIGIQRAQVQRNELRARLAGDGSLEDRLAEVRSVVTTGVQQIDDLVEGAVHLLETAFEPIEEQLPPAAKEIAGRAHAHARELRAQLRELLGAEA